MIVIADLPSLFSASGSRGYEAIAQRADIEDRPAIEASRLADNSFQQKDSHAPASAGSMASCQAI
jgi:hypothetical protein